MAYVKIVAGNLKYLRDFFRIIWTIGQLSKNFWIILIKCLIILLEFQAACQGDRQPQI